MKKTQKLRFAAVTVGLAIVCWLAYWINYVSDSTPSQKQYFKGENLFELSDKHPINQVDKNKFVDNPQTSLAHKDSKKESMPLEKSLLGDSPGAAEKRDQIQLKLLEKENMKYIKKFKSQDRSEPSKQERPAEDKTPKLVVKSNTSGKSIVPPKSKNVVLPIPKIDLDDQHYTLIHAGHASLVHQNTHAATPSLPEGVAKEAYVLKTDKLPTETRLWPSVGNGNLGTVVHSGEVFMAGLYSGFGVNSHRAVIPSTVSFNVSYDPLHMRKTSYSLDLARGMYVEESVSANHNITWRLYAHRSLQHVIVVELELERIEPTPSHLPLQIKKKWTTSYDITFTIHESGVDEVSYKRGRINGQEAESSPSSEVHIYYDHVPPDLTPPANARRTKWVFLTSIASRKQDALDAYEEENLCCAYMAVLCWSV